MELHPVLAPVAAPTIKQAPAGLPKPQRHWCGLFVQCNRCLPADPSHVFHLVHIKLDVVVHSLAYAAHHQLAGATSTYTCTQAESGAAQQLVRHAAAQQHGLAHMTHQPVLSGSAGDAQIEAMCNHSLALLPAALGSPTGQGWEPTISTLLTLMPAGQSNQLLSAQHCPSEKCRSTLSLFHLATEQQAGN